MSRRRGQLYCEDYPDEEENLIPIVHDDPQLAAPSYVPVTLRGPSYRYRILPACPSSLHDDQPPLLLPNVPVNKLSQEQLLYRQSGRFPLTYTADPKYFDIPSYFYSEYQAYMSMLIYKYNVDEPILSYNLARFKQCYDMFIDDYCYHHSCLPEQFEITTKQKNYALEFYLQMDVDLFFMKTCSYRSAKPRSNDEGLYCINEPEARYSLLPCNDCSLCQPPIHSPEQQSTIRFGPNQKFRFMNDY
ncbi:unnamed protein product, partial [Adineta ricciae]